MKMIATTNFKHARAQFVKGGAYDVPDRIGGYFEQTGWAREATADEQKAVQFEALDAAAFDVHSPQPKTSSPQGVDTLTVQDVAQVPVSELKNK